MDLETAQTSFRQLLTEMPDTTRDSFLTWIASTFAPSDADALEESTETLKSIAANIRGQVSTSGVLASEAILPPAKVDIAHTVHVDAFLYDDDVVEELFEEGKMAKYYCTRCDSRSIRPLNFLSHSMSIDRLSFIFNSLLPSLNGRNVVDVGSRFGAVLFAAYAFSSARTIVGLEMNADLCRLQEMVIDSYRMHNRVRVIHGDVVWHPDVLQEADVVFLHNVFEFFLPKDSEIRCWHFLKANIRRTGTLIVAVPDIRECLVKVKIEPDGFLNGWVQKMPLEDVVSSVDAEDVNLYSVV